MATYYVRSTTGVDTNTGADWANAKATLTGAFTSAVAGDTIYVSQAHAESTAANITLASAGTATSPIKVFCVNDASAPPTALATTGAVSTTGASSIAFTGFAYFYGLTFTSGNGVNVAIVKAIDTNPFWLRFESCSLRLGTSNATSANKISFGAASTVSDDQSVELINTTVQFGSTAQGITIRCRFLWQNTPTAIGGANVPTVLFATPTQGNAGLAVVEGVDLSAMGSGTHLVDAGVGNYSTYYFNNCKLGASVAVLNGVSAGQGGVEVYLDNCDSSGTNYRMEHYKYEGSIVQETVKVRSGGASDGTNSLSWKMVSVTGGPTFQRPLVSPPIYIWNDTVATPKTATVEILHDSLTNLKNNEVWLQVMHMGDATDPQGIFVNNRAADVFATAADQATSTATWTTTGLTNPNKQKLAVTFTPNMKGLVKVRVMLAKPNYSIYVDPLITIS